MPADAARRSVDPIDGARTPPARLQWDARQPAGHHLHFSQTEAAQSTDAADTAPYERQSMSTRPLVALRMTPRTWRGALGWVAGWALFWAMAAGILYLAAPGLDSYPRLLVLTECSGMAIILIALALRSSRWFPASRPAVGWLIAGTIAIPAGYVAGHMLAFLILGEPFRVLGHGNDRMVPIVFTALIGGFGLHYFATREHLAREAAARAEAQRSAVESQLRLLRAQLEPHMLFNTLANLRSLVRDDPQQAERMIDQFITYLRGALTASRTESSTLNQEFTQLRAYLEIMSLRMGPRLAFRLALPPELAHTAVPSMLLQPLVENAIKHGLEPKVGPGIVDVTAHRSDAGIEIAVTDTGRGLPPEGESPDPARAAGGGYGLLHVRERLRAAYGPDATLTLSPRQPSGVRAEVRIPP